MRSTSFTVLALLFLISVVRGTTSSSINLHPPDAVIPVQFFGMHFHRLATTTPWPSLHIGAWRFLAANVDWPDLQPHRDAWDFKTMDKYVALAEEHDTEILLPLVRTPSWASSRPQEKSYYSPGNAAVPANISDWREYVETVAKRYKGRIHDYEIWNEPNLPGFYTGSIPEMVNLAKVAYTTIKAVDPSAMICSPSPTEDSGVAWLNDYLRAGGGAYADVIGFHFYSDPGPPEQKTLPLIEHVKQIMKQDGVGNKPLWDTETGYFIQNAQSVVRPQARTGYNSVVLSAAQAGDSMSRMYILAWSAGVSRVYWYAWDDWQTGLVDHDGKTLKVTAIAYQQIENWLTGTKMWACGASNAGVWVCGISRAANYRARIVWRADRPGTFLIPQDWHVSLVRTLTGGSYAPDRTRLVRIGPSPILLVSPNS